MDTSKSVECGVTSEQVWLETMKEHPILGNEYRNMEQMFLELRGKTMSEAREVGWFSRTYQRVYGPSRYGHDVLFRRFGQLKAQLATEEKAMGDALLLPVWTQLLPNSQVTAITNPVALLRLAFGYENGGVVGVRGRVEAITQFILVRLMLTVDETESVVDAGDAMEFAIDWLLKMFFVQGESRKVFYLAQLDDARKPTAISVSTRDIFAAKNATEHHGTLPCRFIHCGEKNILVSLDDRIKTDFGSVLKMLRKGKAVCEAYDKHGITFVVKDEHDADDLAHAVLAKFQETGCDIVEALIEQPKHGVVDLDNPDSDPDFRARRFVFRIPREDEEPVTVELNIQSLAEKLIATISHSSANHDWYTVRRCRKKYFPWRYPHFVYGIDWTDGSSDWRRIAMWIRTRQEHKR